ncbi:hypothetical protein BY996DRAFT_6413780 [Phakopsora pachyrhizi]|nr:hypothetical protein BY996DRAFT_6413780 [Phakopsora pachyrhizi]
MVDKSMETTKSETQIPTTSTSILEAYLKSQTGLEDLPNNDSDSALTLLSCSSNKDKKKLSSIKYKELTTVYITDFKPETKQEYLLSLVKQYGNVQVLRQILKCKYILVQFGSSLKAQRIIACLGNTSNNLQCLWGKKKTL